MQRLIDEGVSVVSWGGVIDHHLLLLLFLLWPGNLHLHFTTTPFFFFFKFNFFSFLFLIIIIIMVKKKGVKNAPFGVILGVVWKLLN